MSSVPHPLILEWWREGWQLSLQITVLAVLVLLLTRVGWRLEPRFRHLLCLLVLVRLLVPVAVTSPVGLLPGDELTSDHDDAHQPDELCDFTPRLELPTIVIPDDAATTLTTESRAGLSLPAVAFASWVGGMLLLALALLRRLWRVKAMLRSCPPAPTSLYRLLHRLQRDLGLRRRVRIVLVPAGSELDAPALFGLRQPTILLPEDMAADWTLAELEPVLLHELVHLKRADPWIHALQVGLQIIYFFHPLVWLINRQLRLEREMACDDRVVELSAGCPQKYMAALLAVASRQRSRSNRWRPVLGMAARPSLLARRLHRLHAPNPRPLRILNVLLVLAGLGALGFASGRGVVPEAPTASLPDLSSPRALIEGDPQIILDWIEQHPTAGETRMAQDFLYPGIDPESHQKAVVLWRKHLEDRPRDPAILGNAGAFFAGIEPDLAAELLLQATALEPWNPIWHGLLADLYRRSPGRELDALEHRELALRSTRDAADQISILVKLPDAALAAGKLEKAHHYARQLLASATSLEGNWRQGNALHRAHLALGRLALRTGQVEQARDHLLRAAEARSPQLRSFGPRMELAHELLQVGEREVVLQYFKACSSFWKSGQERLRCWTGAVERGEIPDFSTRSAC